MSTALLRGATLFTLSLTLHGLVLVSILAVIPAAPSTPLVIDLSELGEAAAPPATATSGRAGEPAARAASKRAAPARPDMAPTPAPAAPPPPPLIAAPPPSSPSPPAPAPAPPTLPTPAPAAPVPDATAPSTLPVPSAPAAVNPPAGGAPSGADVAGARSAADGVPRGGTEQEAEPGGGSSGSRFALARPGDGRGGVPAEYAPYLARFRQRVEAALVYPLSARRAGHSGRVELEVLLEPTGRVGRVEVARSSANAALDEAALDAVRSIPPIPFPETLPRRPLLLRLPLIFELR